MTALSSANIVDSRPQITGERWKSCLKRFPVETASFKESLVGLSVNRLQGVGQKAV
jgi:hypothetical protein